MTHDNRELPSSTTESARAELERLALSPDTAVARAACYMLRRGRRDDLSRQVRALIVLLSGKKDVVEFALGRTNVEPEAEPPFGDYVSDR